MDLSLEEIRSRARLLVIDDHDAPFLTLFQRDGYRIERWNTIERMQPLVDGHYDLILLDLHGVGLLEDPELQGLGILEHIKRSSPTQLVVAYSAQTWDVSHREFFALADAVLDKGDSYRDYKNTIDDLLRRRYSAGYFITKMNEALGDRAILAPRAVSKAKRALRRGEVQPLALYLRSKIADEVTVDRALAVISIGIGLLK